MTTTVKIPVMILSHVRRGISNKADQVVYRAATDRILFPDQVAAAKRGGR
jgi:hypothetical protein